MRALRLIAALLLPMATAQEEAEEPAILCNATFTSDADCQVEASGGHAAMVLNPDSATVECSSVTANRPTM